MDPTTYQIIAAYLNQLRQLPAGLLQAPPQFNFALESQENPYSAVPRLRGSVELPNGLSFSGSYYRPDRQAPPDWSAMLNFRRQF
jgi:hypothetical protein